MSIQNLYSGHGTYATAGLAHYDARVIARFRDQWMKKQMDTARALNAGFGFFAHGFDERLLQNHSLYEQKLFELYDTLADLARYAQNNGVRHVCLEQMYSPHQPPWTIEGTVQLLQAVYSRASAPFYITIDLGHMNGQQYFAMPDEAYIRESIARARAGGSPRRVWMGTDAARRLYLQAVQGTIGVDEAVHAILKDARNNPHLFSRPEDWNIGAWIGRLGCYSPIIHLQQSDGKASPHWPFSREYNQRGIVRAQDVLRALAQSYHSPEDAAMPPRCDEIVLTLEPFISTAGSTADLLDDLRESVIYWRQFVPRDGMRLSEIMHRL